MLSYARGRAGDASSALQECVKMVNFLTSDCKNVPEIG